MFRSGSSFRPSGDESASPARELLFHRVHQRFSFFVNWHFFLPVAIHLLRGGPDLFFQALGQAASRAFVALLCSVGAATVVRIIIA